MKRAGLLLQVLATLIGAFFVVGAKKKEPVPETLSQRSPNVILILMDDMGYGDLECYGGFPYHTPNINRLAREGMKFTNFYAAQATCSASRAAFLTGCYPNRIGINGALSPTSAIALNPNEETIASLLKDNGYKTMAPGAKGAFPAIELWI
jgi:arylsulfatase